MSTNCIYLNFALLQGPETSNDGSIKWITPGQSVQDILSNEYVNGQESLCFPYGEGTVVNFGTMQQTTNIVEIRRMRVLCFPDVNQLPSHRQEIFANSMN